MIDVRADNGENLLTLVVHVDRYEEPTAGAAEASQASNRNG